uniref:Uncharacterized protein n=1 Tax=Ixodes ricinus TaxID=34613 RepID=A0A6B0UV75_IXORI
MVESSTGSFLIATALSQCPSECCPEVDALPWSPDCMLWLAEVNRKSSGSSFARTRVVWPTFWCSWEKYGSSASAQSQLSEVEADEDSSTGSCLIAIGSSHRPSTCRLKRGIPSQFSGSSSPSPVGVGSISSDSFCIFTERLASSRFPV